MCATPAIGYRGNFIAGHWQPVDDPTGTIERENPSRPDTLVFRAPWSVAAVSEAIAAARRALPSWRALGLEGRRERLLAFRAVLASRKESLAETIAQEAGKPRWEARTEAGALTAKIDIMTTAGAEYTRPVTLESIGARVEHRPLGVLAVLGPFNFPLHLPNGHIIPGLLTGNTVVVKPSELTSGCMQQYIECAAEAGLPPGVLNLVHGPGPVGAALAEHADVDAVLFTGSYQTGLHIKRATLEQPWKLLALEMGGKNTTLVRADADLEQAAHEIVQAAYLTCGQRCTATSRVVMHADIADALTERLTALARRVTTGDPLRESCFMGPLIDRRARDRFLEAQRDDEAGTLVPILRGGTARNDLPGYFVSPALWRATELDPAGSHQSAEIFGPDVVLYTADDDDQSVHIANATDYGLAMSVFTRDSACFDDLALRLRAGIVNLNRSTVGASGRLPFGGIKKSGNYRPAAVTAGAYCTYPQAQLLQPAGWDDTGATGLPWSLLSSP